MRTEDVATTMQYLTFRLGGEQFAVDVVKAQEVLDYVVPTRVPQTPAYMLGVINLRGSVVPVIDLRQKFSMPEAQQTRDTCIIVMEVEVDGETIVVGLLVDSVLEVLDLVAESLEPPPRIGTGLKTDFIRGMGSLGEAFLIVLDIDRIFSSDELMSIEEIRQLKGG